MPGPMVPAPITAATFGTLIMQYLRVSAGSQLLNPPPHPFRGERQRVHRHAGVGQRVDHGGRDRGQRALAAALGPERAGAIAILDDRALHCGRYVTESGDPVAEQGVVQQHAVRRENHLLEQGVADALQGRALVLAGDQLRVDGPADVGDGGGAQHGDDAGLGVDLHLGAGHAHLPEDRPLGVGAAAALGLDPAVADKLAAVEAEARADQFGVGHRPAVLIGDGAVGRGEQLRRGLQPGRGRLQQRVQDVLRGPRWTARPATVVDRLAPVDRSYGVYLVSVPRTTTLFIGALSTPTAIWAITVRAPWPSSVVPTRTVTEPSGPIRTVAMETWWAPAASRPTETPRPRRLPFSAERAGGSPHPMASAAFPTSPIRSASRGLPPGRTSSPGRSRFR